MQSYTHRGLETTSKDAPGIRLRVMIDLDFDQLVVWSLTASYVDFRSNHPGSMDLEMQILHV